MGILNITNPQVIDKVMVRKFEGETDPITKEIIRFVVIYDLGYVDAVGKFVQVGPSGGAVVPKETIDKIIPIQNQVSMVTVFDQFVGQILARK